MTSCSHSDETIPGQLPQGNLIVFDGICLVCSGFARFMARHDKTADFRFVDAQSETGRSLYEKYGLDADLMETNIVIVDGQAYTKMASFTAAMHSIGWPWKLLTVFDFLPIGVGNWLYDRIAQNRYRLGRRACPLPSKELKDRLID
ncbi:DCC1-like thiol-disulfide oxidoreductase family protein [Roseibium porphyridii]|uniref:DCC1-like thiol-disulfide oxidoreductase family protein n=1 Tax=Roseibium porphyridii TaxID=2866279 RepID=A0ABY8F8R6_9HYPH|nr:DCC1-like thiol-disulfide oxidoreductase family protein [Roseibium sp. KMA01]WFE91726.1 DCC1-like thiol-disulfide oxidoreductase family protein [Roseibium sp. KMA01]